MANSAYGTHLTSKMRGCLTTCKAEGLLIRKPGGRWYGEHQREVFPRYLDVTVHALIVRGLLEVAGRHQVNRKPLAVKIAKEPV